MKSVPLSSNIPSRSSSRNIASPPISISKASKRSLSPVAKHQTKIVVTQKTAPGRTLPKKPPILEKRKFIVKPPVKPKPSNVPANGLYVKAATDIPIVAQSSSQDINATRFSVSNQFDTSTGHNVEAVEDIPVVSQPSSQYIGTDSSSTPKKVDICSVELQQILKENSHQMHTSDEQVIGDDGVATLRPETESQHVIPDELLLILNLVKSIIIYPTRCINDTTPVPNQRNRKLSRWNFSPFTTKFGSSSGTSTSASCDSPILNKKHPFTPFIGYRYDPSIENKYLKWIKEGLLTTHERKNLILRYSAPDVLLCFGIMVEKKSEAMSDYEAPAKMHRPVTDWDSRKDVPVIQSHLKKDAQEFLACNNMSNMDLVLPKGFGKVASKEYVVLVFLISIVAVTKSGNIQSHFGKSESSGKAVVVHEPYKGLDLFGYSKMPDPNGGDITSEGMLFHVDNVMVGTFT
ncbi:hypothetical protein FXO38_04148 [Capsicum annuum]|nr:hypothetical protein FXO38_04148 [Capsicum annuum]